MQALGTRGGVGQEAEHWAGPVRGLGWELTGCDMKLENGRRDEIDGAG